MQIIQGTIAILKKDFQLELRSRYGINTVLAFVASATMVLFFSLKTTLLTPELYSGLLWVIILFAAMGSLSRSFVMESDRQTFDLLRLNTPGIPVFVGKLIFNFLFTFVVSILTTLLFTVLTGTFSGHIGALFCILFLGSLGFSSVSTLMASLVSRANQKGAIFSVLCLPLLLPLIIILSDATREITAGAFFSEILEPITSLIGYCGVTITLSILLFEYVWID